MAEGKCVPIFRNGIYSHAGPFAELLGALYLGQYPYHWSKELLDHNHFKSTVV